MKNKNNLEKIKEILKKCHEIHLEEEALLVKELGEFGIGSGFELYMPNIPSLRRCETDEEYEEEALIESIRRFWSDAGNCYKNRRFRACAILLACLVEAVVCLELLKREKSYPKDATLGQLIGYCERKRILSEILADLKSVNKLRKIAVHLFYEKRKPKVIFESEIFDEIVPLEKFKNPPAKIEKNKGGYYVIGDDVELNIVKRAIKYRYKKLAMKMYTHVQHILKHLYGCEFKFEFTTAL